jgi:hypothetical protein
MRILKILGWYCTLTVAAALGLLVLALPYHPKSSIGWIVFFILALPISLIGEAIGEGLWRNPLAKRIEERSSQSTLSLSRIVYGFFAMLLVFFAAWALVSFFGVERGL